MPIVTAWVEDCGNSSQDRTDPVRRIYLRSGGKFYITRFFTEELTSIEAGWVSKNRVLRAKVKPATKILLHSLARKISKGLKKDLVRKIDPSKHRHCGIRFVI